MNNKPFDELPIIDKRVYVKSIFKRVSKAYKVDNIKELAVIFGCTFGALKNNQSAGRVPLTHLHQCHLETGVSMDWLLTGKMANIVFTPKTLEQLRSSLHREILTAASFGLLNEGRQDGLLALTGGLTESILNLMDIEIIDKNDLLTNFKINPNSEV